MRFSSSSRLALAFSATLAAALTGCATSGPLGGSGTIVAPLTSSTLGGRVHGGNQPVVGATVTLWAAGAPLTGGGYGAGATVVSTTTTSASGTFTFNTAGASPCTTGQYLYVTATGGNTGAGVNTYSAMMAAFPSPCGAATASTFIQVNEETTIAAVWALQQFMTITPTGVVKWQVGSPSTNVTGLANAFLQSAQLASVTSGVSGVTTVANSVGGTSYTTTITPDVSRINTLADILSSCINTAGNSTCTSLFADTTPGTATAPTDTIQVAYYLATNPGGLTMPAHNAINSPTYLCSQYVPAAGAPFLPTLSCGTGNTSNINTDDWLLGVMWQTNVTGSTTCGQTGASCIGTLVAASVAVDHTGNVWVGGGSGATASALITEFNQTGQEILTPVGSSVAIPAYNLNYIATSTPTALAYAGTGSSPLALGYGRPTSSLAIDTNNNAWFDSFSPTTTPGTLTNGSTSVATGIVTEVTPSGTVNGFLGPVSAGVIAIDGFNNLYISGEPVSSRYYLTELESGAQTGETGTAFQTLDEGSGRQTGIFNGVFVDSNQYAWGLSSSTTCGTSSAPITIDRTNTAGQESQATTGDPATSITDAVGCAFYGAPDANGNAWVTASGNLYYLNTSASTAAAPAAVVTTFAGTTNGTATGNGGLGGLDNATGVAVDGSGNVWVANKVLASTTAGLAGGLSEFVPTTNSNQTTTAVALSPGGSNTTSQAGAFGFNEFNAYGAQGIVIDSSGNLWLETTGGSALWHMVGAAAPVVTPVALALKNGTLATKP